MEEKKLGTIVKIEPMAASFLKEFASDNKKKLEDMNASLRKFIGDVNGKWSSKIFEFLTSEEREWFEVHKTTSSINIQNKDGSSIPGAYAENYEVAVMRIKSGKEMLTESDFVDVFKILKKLNDNAEKLKLKMSFSFNNISTAIFIFDPDKENSLMLSRRSMRYVENNKPLYDKIQQMLIGINTILEKIK